MILINILLLIVLGIIIAVLIDIKKKMPKEISYSSQPINNNSQPSFFNNPEVNPNHKNYRINPEKLARYRNIVDNLSDDELLKVSDEIMNRVIIPEMAVGACYYAPNIDSSESLEDFYKKPIKGGEICGCKTNLEALELSKVYRDRLDTISEKQS